MHPLVEGPPAPKVPAGTCSTSRHQCKQTAQVSAGRSGEWRLLPDSCCTRILLSCLPAAHSGGRHSSRCSRCAQPLFGHTQGYRASATQFWNVLQTAGRTGYHAPSVCLCHLQGIASLQANQHQLAPALFSASHQARVPTGRPYNPKPTAAARRLMVLSPHKMRRARSGPAANLQGLRSMPCGCSWRPSNTFGVASGPLRNT